ncbi:MAG: alpha/beta fold hydrolase [Acidobacteriota bacterium]
MTERNLFRAILITTLLLLPKTSFAHKEEEFRIPSGIDSLKLSLLHISPARGKAVKEGRVVLFLHGATFPSRLAAGFRFAGHSWMDDLSNAGFDVWALDFLGYGNSDRYPQMSMPAESREVLGRATQVATQVSQAVEFITKKQKVSKLSLIAHSWGTMVAGLFATQAPNRIDRLVLFGPVTLRHTEQSLEQALPAYHYVTTQQQWERFSGYVPKAELPVFEKREFDIWAKAYLASDPTSTMRTPSSVKIPYGPVADADAAWSGEFVYNPSAIKAPTLIIRGEWDIVTTYEDAAWLYKALSSTVWKRDVVISRGTHVMHLEESRFQLYHEVQLFLEEKERPFPAKR